jgi:hypothetical protein
MSCGNVTNLVVKALWHENNSTLAVQEQTETRILWPNTLNGQHFYTNDLNIRPCQGCLTCETSVDHRCAIQDDMEGIFRVTQGNWRKHINWGNVWDCHTRTFTRTQIAERKTNEQKSNCCSEHSWNASPGAWVNNPSSTWRGYVHYRQRAYRRRVRDGER